MRLEILSRGKATSNGKEKTLHSDLRFSTPKYQFCIFENFLILTQNALFWDDQKIMFFLKISQLDLKTKNPFCQKFSKTFKKLFPKTDFWSFELKIYFFWCKTMIFEDFGLQLGRPAGEKIQRRSNIYAPTSSCDVSLATGARKPVYTPKFRKFSEFFNFLKIFSIFDQIGHFFARNVNSDFEI